jgi:hypothetical protein
MLEVPAIPQKLRTRRAAESDAAVNSAVSNVFFRRLLEIKLERRQKPLQHVYFAQSVDGGPIKIGCAVDVEKRLKSIQVGSPTKIVLLGVIMGGGHKKELELHKRFASQRMESEWFAVSEELLAEIYQANQE